MNEESLSFNLLCIGEPEFTVRECLDKSVLLGPITSPLLPESGCVIRDVTEVIITKSKSFITSIAYNFYQIKEAKLFLRVTILFMLARYSSRTMMAASLHACVKQTIATLAPVATLLLSNQMLQLHLQRVIREDSI